MQKANTDRLKVLKQILSDATKAGDFDAASAIKERVTAAEAEGTQWVKPKNTAQFGGHEYAVIADKLTWHQAKRRCEEMGGHLVTFESPREQAFVLDYCRRNKVDVWLRLSNENNFKWTWVTGEPATVDPTWKLDDPQREYFAGALTFWNDSNGFNDHNLGAFIGCVCEWDK